MLDTLFEVIQGRDVLLMRIFFGLLFFWRERVREYQSYIFDIDGTLIKQHQVLPGASAYLQNLRQKNKQILFATNNPVSTRLMIANHLQQLGILAHPDEIITPIDAVDIFLEQVKQPVSILGLIAPMVSTELSSRGWRVTPAAEGHLSEVYSHLILGMNEALTYQDLALGLKHVDKGSLLIVLNPDLFCPVPEGRVPDSGALSSVFEVCTGREGVVVGKPTQWMQQAIESKLSAPPAECLFIGDSPFTDITMGMAMGMDTLFLQSGVSLFSKPPDDIQPTYSFTNLSDVLEIIEK